MRKADIPKLSVIQLICECNKKGIAEGTKEQMAEALQNFDPKAVVED